MNVEHATHSTFALAEGSPHLVDVLSVCLETHPDEDCSVLSFSAKRMLEVVPEHTSIVCKDTKTYCCSSRVAEA